MPITCITTRPDPDAVAALHTPELIRRFAVGIEAFDHRVVHLSDAQLDTAFFPDADVGRWPCRVLLGHLADAELVFVHRMRRAVGEDNPVLALWDENAFIDRGMYGPVAASPGTPEHAAHRPAPTSKSLAVGAFLATIHTLRAWTTPWLGTLDDPTLARAVLHPEQGRLTVRDILVYDTWHLEHHAYYLNLKVAKIIAASPPPNHA